MGSPATGIPIKSTSIRILSVNEVVEHWPDEKEGQVGVDVKLCEELLNTGEVACVVVLAEVAGQEGAELDEGVVALVDQLEVILLSLLVHDAAALLGHQEDQWHGQMVVHEAVLQALTRLPSVLHLKQKMQDS